MATIADQDPDTDKKNSSVSGTLLLKDFKRKHLCRWFFQTFYKVKSLYNSGPSTFYCLIFKFYTQTQMLKNEHPWVSYTVHRNVTLSGHLSSDTWTGQKYCRPFPTDKYSMHLAKHGKDQGFFQEKLTIWFTRFFIENFLLNFKRNLYKC
jgi:hypothetical protein